MIFYFSGTGNSKWVADKIAEKICDKAYDISELNDIPKLSYEKQIGFVFPIYAWGVPEPMNLFIKKLKKTNLFTFAVCTCGANAGLALKKLSSIYHLDSSYSVIMPNNYIIGSELEKKSIILKKLKNAQNDIDKISQNIIEQKNGYFVKEGMFPIIKSTFINKGFNKFARSTNHFYVNKEKCNGCGLCATMCPIHTIEMHNGKPTWNDKCYRCLRCINKCPQVAIQYGKKTAKRGRYNIDEYL